MFASNKKFRDGILRERREHARGRNLAEGFVEVPVNLYVQLKKCGKIFQMINYVGHFDEETLIIPQCGKQLGIFSTIR